MKRWFLDHGAETDIFHSHGLWMMPNVYAAVPSLVHGGHYIVSPRGTLSEVALKFSPHAKKLFWLTHQKRALNRACVLHATSEDEYLDIRRAGLTQPVAVIQNGIDVPRVSGGQHRKRENTLLYLGRIHPKKGLELAIRVWGQLCREFHDWTFRIVGRGAATYITGLKGLCRTTGARRVRFEGPLYGDEKLSAMMSASLSILPTKNENFGMVVAESLACGTPVVTTRGAPWRALVANACGWWVHQDENALEAALREALSLDEKTLSAMGRAGREWMLRDYDWASIAQRMNEVYKWTLLRTAKPECLRID